MTVACTRDNECSTNWCEASICWSWHWLPSQCLHGSEFYRCPSANCISDGHCYSLNCTEGQCADSPWTRAEPGNCTEAASGVENKCPYVPCGSNDECQSRYCKLKSYFGDGVGLCQPLSPNECTIDPTSKYNRCSGIQCTRDNQCQSGLCDEDGLCEEPGVSAGLKLVIGLSLTISLGCYCTIRIQIRKRNAALSA